MTTTTTSAPSKARELSTWEQLQRSRPLPLSFVLFDSQRTNGALCPSLVVQHLGISVVRILDPEHRQPFVSLDAILLMANRSVVQGILEFDLRRDRGDYDLTLAGLEPREAVWAPLKVARRVAEQLGLLPPLAMLLDWDTRHIWSLDEGVGGLVHNWRATELDAASYSTGSLVDCSLRSISPLPKGQQIRTLISHDQRLEARTRPACILDEAKRGRYRMEQRLLRWSVLACEELDRTSEERASPESDDGGEASFQLHTADFLLLFHNWLETLDADTASAPVEVSAEDMAAGRQSSAEDVAAGRQSSTEGASTKAASRSARIHAALIHHLWTLYLTQAAPPPALQVAPQPQDGQDEVGQRLLQLEEHARVASMDLHELLARKPRPDVQPGRQVAPAPPPDARLPAAPLADVRLLLAALLLGLLVGSATTRAAQV